MQWLDGLLAGCLDFFVVVNSKSDIENGCNDEVAYPKVKMVIADEPDGEREHDDKKDVE